MKEIIFGLIAILFFSGTALADGQGKEGGDGVYQNGQLILRDFITAGRENGSLSLIANNSEFLNSTKGFDTLLQDIAKVNPNFSQAVWEQLKEAHIWITNETLPLLPESVTTVVGPKAQVQIAVRDGDDIVISRPAFAKVDENFVLLHEALQGLIPGSGPFHHERVRILVDYIHKNQKNLNEADFQNILNQYDFEATSFDSDPIYQLALKILGAGIGSQEARCVLRKYAQVNSEWQKADICNSNLNAKNLVSRQDPKLIQFFQAGFAEDPIEIPNVIKIGKEVKASEYACHWMGSNFVLEKYDIAIQRTLSELNAFNNGYAQKIKSIGQEDPFKTADPAFSVVRKYFVIESLKTGEDFNFDTGPEGLLQQLPLLRTNKAIVQENIEKCGRYTDQ